jgi:glutamate-1-semialdehyde 2,1-aminomutase
VIVATSTSHQDDVLVKHLKELGVFYFRGEENDVLSRFMSINALVHPNVIVRITGDCPFVDPNIVDSVVNMLTTHAADYCSNVEPPSFPHGLDVEAFTADLLNWTQHHAESPEAREHVTTLMRQNNSINKKNVTSGGEHSHIRVTLDNPEDLEVMQNVASSVTSMLDFGWSEIVDLHKMQPELFLPNNNLIVRGAGQAPMPEEL